MSSRARLLWAVAAGLAAYVLSRGAITVFLGAYACPAPDSWWPAWATICSDRGLEGLARRLIRVSWDGALPVILGAIGFALAGWAPWRR
ncbi:MAG: hypothetical protein AAFY65_06030 [Pseudomonadota bacterium]